MYDEKSFTKSNYNFDVEGSNWIGLNITSKAAFESEFGVTANAFKLTGNKIEAEITAIPSGSLSLSNKSITTVNYIHPSGLNSLQISNNPSLTEFDPIRSLSSSLRTLILESNGLTSFNPTLALPNSIEYLSLNWNPLNVFNPTLALPTSLMNLSLESTNLSSFNPSIVLPSNLRSLDLSNNNLTVFFTNHSLPDSLRVLKLEYNELTEFDPIRTLPSNLQGLNLIGNQLTKFAPINEPLPTTLADIYVMNNLITTAGYTASEAWANALPASTGVTIYFAGNTNLVLGTTLETILVSKGWSVSG